MKRLKLTTLAMVVLLNTASAQTVTFDHGKFDRLLQTSVINGLVNYKALNANGSDLDIYLKQLEQVDPKDFNNWTKNAKMAFWINAYNGITIHGILRNYPIKWGGFFAKRRFPQNSIRQIGKFWDTVFTKTMGKELTLNQIEHDILRKQFKNPLIHFVIVCASIGCPVLENKVFLAEDLDARLEKAAFDFINDPEKVRLDKKNKIFYLSAIFDWYKEDFQASAESDQLLKKYNKKERGTVGFIIRYLPDSAKSFVINNKIKIKYLDYDWSLNEQK